MSSGWPLLKVVSDELDGFDFGGGFLAIFSDGDILNEDVLLML